MTYDEFQRRLGKAGLSVREFAELLRMNPNSVSNCARRGDVPAHLAVIVTLMGELAERGFNYRDVILGLDIEAKKPRGGASAGRFGGDRQAALRLTGEDARNDT